MKKGQLVVGTIIGAAAGVIAGVLTAPKSGKETRTDLKLKASELKHRAEDKAKQETRNVKTKLAHKAKKSDE